VKSQGLQKSDKTEENKTNVWFTLMAKI